ncbi:lipoprotein [Hymenobacter arcticus]
MKRPLLYALLLPLLTGCQPDPTTGTTTVEGQVVDSQSHQDVSNATVQVYQAPAIWRLPSGCPRSSTARRAIFHSSTAGFPA